MNRIVVNKQNQDIKITKNDTYYLEITKDNLTLNIDIDDYIEANIYIIVKDKSLTLNNTIDLHEKSLLNIYKFYNNHDLLENTTINLEGLFSTINYFSSSIATSDEIYNITINHHNNNTISNIINKAITLDKSKVLFNVDSVIPKDITGATMNQDSRIITLEESNAIIKPNMYIESNDVEAKHSSIVGTLNEKDIFYLMSRGITYEESLSLLIKGFILANYCEEIEIHEEVLKIINKYWR